MILANPYIAFSYYADGKIYSKPTEQGSKTQ